MSVLWTAAEAAAATGGEARGDWQAEGVSIDTRTLVAGDLFVALKAARDGHEFVAQALEKGAAAALVTHVPEGVAPDAPLLIVGDVLEGLEGLARAARARISGRVVAVTGSAGKTSTKEMLRDVFSGQKKTHAAEASYNNHWGVPLTLARMPRDTELAVIEIGMNHPGEIAPLTRLARPDVAIITTVVAAHLEAFENLEGIAREKGSICEGLEPGGVAVINGDLPTTPILVEAARRAGAKVLRFGESRHCHHRLLKVTLAEDCLVCEARAWRTPMTWKVQAAGRHFALNALAVLATAHVLGLDRALALAALGRWVPPAGRGLRQQRVLDPLERALSFELIDDAFNANPASMGAALDVLAAARPRDNLGRHAHGRRIAVLGEMLELGETELELHAGLASHPALKQIDLVHCVGERMQPFYDALPDHARGRFCKTARPLAEQALRLVDAGDVVLVKGSKGSKVSTVVDALRKLSHPADD
ncbi:UDP-N-acetylmuramoyl-tripeptide--D-alanyl-D-alanine ligase [Pseudooceanicola antarcticus]|uniref:UDP-N-acetylmuramoyl-tripeptide--D-alanyl-D-alanine ligase n=1 Tax=Pseudooceanicola antarcticus TaxID=1247613 RepID=A0A285J346_9RHOB|nr:UDP-N-acetylmuramoyl-tripeptide--D-alanyl-D-alanine ligase [Pseudooceanicola antarcticus]PJE29711.1 UDP-N-acetylmuramoyl-tripeptide--D-alanyl-D-alanine ligase [Pseudooceanicola antarcticus]SNY54729.1 UDP-N-acetylmuramoyl-tripeptide--D-alanyl-D-alanine ligase [Pseudooceanicola antarcticus]